MLPSYAISVPHTHNSLHIVLSLLNVIPSHHLDLANVIFILPLKEVYLLEQLLLMMLDGPKKHQHSIATLRYDLEHLP